jgi:hypothetical protein
MLGVINNHGTVGFLELVMNHEYFEDFVENVAAVSELV